MEAREIREIGLQHILGIIMHTLQKKHCMIILEMSIHELGNLDITTGSE